MTDQRLSDQGAQAQAASEAPAAGAAQSAPFPPSSGWMPAPQAAAPAAYPLPTRPAPRTTQGRDLLAAALVLLFCFLYWDSLFWAEKLGVGEAVSLAGLLLTAVWYQRKAGRQITAYGVLCSVLFAGGAVCFALSADNLLKFLLLPVLCVLFILRIIERMALRTGDGLRRRLRDFFVTIFRVGFGRMKQTMPAIFRTKDGKGRGKRIVGVLIGVACALPALCILIPLLTSSDAAFDALMNRLDFSSVLRGGVAFFFAAGMAIVVFTLLFTTDQPLTQPYTRTSRGMDPVIIVSFLGVISLAYVLYLVSQFAYFTSAFRGLLPRDYTVAQYARRGFFEMCVIVAINLAMIVLATRLCRKNEGQLPVAVTGLAVFLCLFSLVLTATALSKMVLYVQSFGMTRMRILTSVFILFLAAVIVAVLLRLFRPKLPVLQFAVVLGVALLIALNLANVDGIVARYNVDAYRSGKLDSLDMSTIRELGDGAVPSLAELMDDENPKYAASAREELRRRLTLHGLAEWESGVQYAADEPEDLRSWNLISNRARTVLEQVRDELLPYNASAPSMSGR